MNEDDIDKSKRKMQKVRGNRTEVSQSAVMAALSQLLRAPGVAVQTQANVSLVEPLITEGMSIASNQGHAQSPTVIQAHTHLPPSNQKLLESLVQTHLQADTTVNNQCLSQIQHAQDEMLVGSQATGMASQVHSQHADLRDQGLPGHSHIQMHPQQTDAQVGLQSQLHGQTQAAVMHSIGDLLQAQINSEISHQTPKMEDELTSVRIPTSRQQPSSNGVISLQDLTSNSLDLSEISSISQAKLLSALTSLAESNQLNAGTIVGVPPQNGNGMVLTQSLTNAQIIDALMASKNTNCQTTLGPPSSVSVSGIDGLHAMRLQGNYTMTRTEDSTAAPAVSGLLSQDRLPPSHSALLETHILNPQISASQLNLDTCKLETSDASVSTLISANKILNRLLDTNKPHIPSHIAKAAEIAHLIPNPSIRTSTGMTRSGDLEDVPLEMTFSTSNRGGSPLTTQTRSAGTSMCTVTGALRTSSGYGDSSIKTLPTMLLENANFQLNHNPILLSTVGAQNPMPQQKPFDATEHALLGPHNTSIIEDPRLDELGHDPQKLFQASPVGPISTSNYPISGINILSSSDKTKRNFVLTPNHLTNVRTVSSTCMTDLINKNNASIESHPRPQMTLSTKQGLITSSDPMFHSVVSSGGPLSSINVHGQSKPALPLQDNTPRLKTQVTDSRITQQLADFMSRSSSSDIVYDVGTLNMPLEMPDTTRISHTGDVLLSELHRSDETELGLNSSLNGAGDDLHSNTNALVPETALGASIGSDSAPPPPPLQGLPSPPLSSFSFSNISSDFMVGSIPGNKLSSGQGPFPALLSNLATTADLDQLLENSSMCIDISSLSESEVSLSATTGAFAYSPDKLSSKKSSSPSSDLTFTNALKDATMKNDEDLKLHCDSNLPSRTSEQRFDAKLSGLDINALYSSSSEQNGSSVAIQGPASRSKKQDSVVSSKSSSGNKEKRKEMFRKNEQLVQQVACFKCRLCSFLSQYKGEIVNHMKQLHSQFLSDSEDSETEEAPAKKIKTHHSGKDPPQQEHSTESQAPVRNGLKNNHLLASKFKVRNCGFESESLFQTIIKEEDDLGKCSIFIKMEPLEDSAEKAKEMESKIVAPQAEGVQTMEDDNTNDSSATNDSGASKTKQGSGKIGRPVSSKSTGITKLKKINPDVQVQDQVAGIRCDVNNCGLRMKSESNIVYHRKCHQGPKLVCQECGEMFKMWPNLAVHLWRQHMIDMELYKCDKCDYKSYNYRKLMNVHYKIHSEERPSLCEQCGKRFKTVKQLRSHTALHMRKLNSPQHRCEKCQRPFSDKRMLRNHMESVHNKVKPFLCNYCGYSTASRSTLKMHMRQHTGEKPFACEICTYRTADHNSLRRHRMQHSGVRPYRCPYCEYASIQATTFKVHLRDKHPCLADGIVFTCGICKFETIKKDNYLAHVAEHNRGENKRMIESALAAISNKDNLAAIVSEGSQRDEMMTGDIAKATLNSKIQHGTLLNSTPIPHVVNIDVESGAVTIESPQTNQFVDSVAIQESIQSQVPGQVTLDGDQYIYAALDSSLLSRMRAGDGVVHITRDVVAIPISTETEETPGIQGVVYVTTNEGEGQ